MSDPVYSLIRAHNHLLSFKSYLVRSALNSLDHLLYYYIPSRALSSSFLPSTLSQSLYFHILPLYPFLSFILYKHLKGLSHEMDFNNVDES